MFRIGMGYDIHRLEEGRRLILGGVNIPHELGLAGHSDADVLIHALMDALLGAMSLPDIGHFFPDDDQRYRDASSLWMLNEVSRMLVEREYMLVNADSTIIAQRPKLSPYILSMKSCIAGVLGVPEERISIKATTNEGLDATGRGEGIAAQVVALLSSHE